MLWEKPSGQRMEAQDNEATNKYLTSLGFKKVGIEIGDPEGDVKPGAGDGTLKGSDPDEGADADGQPNPPEATDSPEPRKEEQSIDAAEVGEMPKEILNE